MKSIFKKVASKAALAIACLALSVPITASAWGITGEDFYYTNNNGTKIVCAPRNTGVRATGKMTYDATLWSWIPLPSTCYYNLEIPAGSLNRPWKLEGDWNKVEDFYYVGYSEYCENSTFCFSANFSCASTKTKKCTAYTSSKSYSTYAYTGAVNSGSDHLSDAGSPCDFWTY